MTTSEWHKSTHSDSANSVEVRRVHGGIYVRDSQRPDDVLAFTLDEWNAFIAGAKAGEFDWR